MDDRRESRLPLHLDIKNTLDSLAKVGVGLRNDFSDFKIATDKYKMKMDSLTDVIRYLTQKQFDVNRVKGEWESLLQSESSNRKRKIIHAQSGGDLWDKLGNNKEFYFKNSIPFDITSTTYQKGYIDGIEYDVYQPLNINNIKNVRLIGASGSFSHLLSFDLTQPIIIFNNCENITLKNLEIGHDKSSMGGCGDPAVVLEFNNCKNVTIDSCRLFGSGSWGIVATGTTNLYCLNSSIYDCSQGAVDMKKCNQFYFYDCNFNNIHIYTDSPFKFQDCLDINFNTCMFTNNHQIQEPVALSAFSPKRGYLFDVNCETAINIVNSLIEENRVYYLSKKSSDIVLDHTSLRHNEFILSRYEN